MGPLLPFQPFVKTTTMKHLTLSVVLLALLLLNSSKTHAQLQTKLFIELPAYCTVPDNLAVSPDGTLTVTCPNFTGKKAGVIVSITPHKEVRKLVQLPRKEPGTYGRPMGLDYGPDGSLFVCNNLGKGQGQVLRIFFREGRPDSIRVIAEGFVPNGLKYHDEQIFVTQPIMPLLTTDSSVTGGLYCFDENATQIQISGKLNDPHLLFSAETTNPNRRVGLDGLTFDPEGRLYVAEFGDATIYRLSRDANGRYTNYELYAQLPLNTGIDGMLMDDRNNLYIAGFSLNQLLRVTPDRKTKILAQYPDNNGANGELDQPVDLCFYDGKLLISNFDLMAAPGMVNRSHRAPHTISYLNMEELNEAQ